ncbi:MAG: hypothetical protein J6V83_04595 [Clostridia bacterium]|nr:hypothetical protein [Clostridia bacterium]
MKKLLACILMLVVAVTALSTFVGCTSKDEEAVPAITAITAKVSADADFNVGEKFDSKYITVTAKLDDKTTSAVSTTAAISYDLAALKLDDDGKFTEAGNFDLKVTFSDWSTTVVIKVAA